jgi:hypothetical protein
LEQKNTAGIQQNCPLKPDFLLAFKNIFLYNKEARRRSQVARQESAKLPFGGPNPPVASNYFNLTLCSDIKFVLMTIASFKDSAKQYSPLPSQYPLFVSGREARKTRAY